MKTGFNFLKKRDFWYQFMIDVLLILFIVALVMLFKQVINAIVASDLPGLSPIDTAKTFLTPSDVNNLENVAKMQFKVISSVFLLFLLMFFGYVFSRALIYTRVLEKKLTKIFFWKYCLMQIIWGIILLILAYIFQFLLFLLFTRTTNNNIMSSILFFLVAIAMVVFLAYLTINFFLAFTRVQKIGKTFVEYYKNNILGIKQFWKKLFWSFIVLIIINLVLLVVIVIPYRSTFTVVATILFIMYAAWLRLYFAEKSTEKKLIFKSKKIKKNYNKGKKKNIKKRKRGR